MGDDELLETLHAAATAVSRALADLADWGPAGTRPSQYRCDLVADEAAIGVLDAAGLGVMSEESGARHGSRDVVVVVDPVDGSTNAARGIPWYATSLCAVDGDGPRAAVVVNQVNGDRFEATRGGGARKDGLPLQPSACRSLREAVVGSSGYPARHLGWSQFRAFGAAALELCAVAEGVLDAFIVAGFSRLGSWDYLGAMLVCTESGAVVAEEDGMELLTLDHAARRRPVAAATNELLGELQAALAQ